MSEFNLQNKYRHGGEGYHPTLVPAAQVAVIADLTHQLTALSEKRENVRARTDEEVVKFAKEGRAFYDKILDIQQAVYDGHGGRAFSGNSDLDVEAQATIQSLLKLAKLTYGELFQQAQKALTKAAGL